MASARAMLTTRQYEYTPLNALKENEIAHVYGVVSLRKVPEKHKAQVLATVLMFVKQESLFIDLLTIHDYIKILSIVDPSCSGTDQKLKCSLFARDEGDLPMVKIGSIVRFHRLRINLYEDKLQGKNGPGFSWLVVDGQMDGCMMPKASHANYTLTDIDKKKIEELLLLIEGNEELSCKYQLKTLEQIQEGMYFDLVCQIVAMSGVKDDVSLPNVRDGTCPANPDTEGNTPEVKAFDVIIYDEHYIKAKELKPGMYIKLCNLHAEKDKYQDTREDLSALEKLKLVLHGGSSYGRGVKILPETDAEVQNLKRRLDESSKNGTQLAVEESVIDSGETQPGCSTAEQPDNETDEASFLSTIIRVDPNEESSLPEATQADQSSVELNSDLLDISQNICKDGKYCMLTTATVIDGHHHIKISKMSEIINSEEYSKFCLLENVLDYYPKPSNLSSFLKLYCRLCHYLIAKSDLSPAEPPVKTEDGVEYYSCPNCMKKQVQADIPILEYIYMVKFILTDGSNYVIANLWRDEAVKFFKNITPVQLLTDTEAMNKVCHYLDLIYSSDKDKQCLPLIEYCIRSYMGSSLTCYKIFDTIIAT